MKVCGHPPGKADAAAMPTVYPNNCSNVYLRYLAGNQNVLAARLPEPPYSPGKGEGAIRPFL